ncbi:MFS transporter, partial [Hafnia paralvei]|uniref:YbfB/YjiJ family MFS transporter n=1 Tax=Hafnia paralvei TaxID=546367 RepID=UPI001F2492E9
MAVRIALSGFLALVVAMGIGRFAFTPQVPLMIAEHQFSLTGAGLVAALNKLGYLAGAFDARPASRSVERRFQLGLCGSVVSPPLSPGVSGFWGSSLIR